MEGLLLPRKEVENRMGGRVRRREGRKSERLRTEEGEGGEVN